MLQSVFRDYTVTHHWYVLPTSASGWYRNCSKIRTHWFDNGPHVTYGTLYW